MISTVSILPLSLRSRISSCRCEVEIASLKEENKTDASFPSQVVALTNTGLRACACGFSRPVKIVNDAAMQALGGYERGKLLFLDWEPDLDQP